MNFKVVAMHKAPCIEGIFSIDMGSGKILSVQNLKEELVFWVEEDLCREFVSSREFKAIYTRDNIPDGVYLGTVQFDCGNTIRHIYEIFRVRGAL